MATTFSVISLGVFADLDPTENNTTAENADALVGVTFGGPGNALANNVAVFTPVGNLGTVYDQDSKPAEHFRINGGNPPAV